MVYLPALVLPKEFLQLLKESRTTSQQNVLGEGFKKSPGLVMMLERAFGEFNEHKIGLEKIANTLGWEHFRDRLASVYIYKTLNSSFPDKTDMSLVEEVKAIERRFSETSLAGNSRLLLLGFYLKMFNLYESFQQDSLTRIPASVDHLLSLGKVRTDKADLLILMVWHMDQFLGAAQLEQLIRAGIKWNELYAMLSATQKFHLVSNLLSYGASIQDDDPFLYERI